jgi:TolB protein
MTGSLLLTGEFGRWDASVQAFALPALAHAPDWSGATLPEVPRGSLAFATTAPQSPAYEERLVVEPQPGQEAPYSLVNLQSLGVIAEAPYLSDRVDGSFSALRTAVNQAAGWDFLGQLDSAMWDLGRRPEPGQAFRNWHKAGRAFDVVQNHSLGDPAQIELVPEQRGTDLYWHLYVRCAIQDGSLGAPLPDYPWDFNARISGNVDAYETGGVLKSEIPTGYYVDFTELARLFGWTPVPADVSWRYNWAGILFWQYEKRDELDWWSAMLELYPESTLVSEFGAPPGPEAGATSQPIPLEENGS